MPTLVALQEANLAIETGRPGRRDLAAEVTDNVADFEIVVVQFTPLDRRFIERPSGSK